MPSSIANIGSMGSPTAGSCHGGSSNPASARGQHDAVESRSSPTHHARRASVPPRRAQSASAVVITPLASVLEWASALGCALMAGVFFAFSSFVMPALARLGAPHGIETMQAINRAALQVPFLSAFVGTAVACALLAALSLAQLAEPRARYRLAAAALYLLGTFVLTIVVHVPRNEALDRLDPSSGAAATEWLRYLAEWTVWNHMRAGAALLALALILLAR